MAISSFEDFCASLCELIGVPPPALVPDANGITGFTVTRNATRIGLASDTRGSEPAVVMMVTLGSAPAADELPVLRALLQANHTQLGLDAPTFMRDPTGNLWQCHVFPLARLDVRRVHQALDAAVATVHAWQTHHFLEQPAAPSGEPPPWAFNLLSLA